MGKPVPRSYPFTWRCTHKAPGPEDVEKRLKEIIDLWMGNAKSEKKEEDKYADALKQALKRFLKETPAGKKLKDLLLSKRVLPLTLMVGGAALTGILVDKRDIPSIPEIPLWRKITVSADIEGNITAPKKILLKFSMPIGGSQKPRAPNKAAATPGVPAKVATEIRRIVDDEALRTWIVNQAKWEYEIAGPREEERKLIFRNWAANPKNRQELPGMHSLADHLTAKLLAAAKARHREAKVRLVDERIWPAITDLTGLWERLVGLVAVVSPLLGREIQGVEQVTFEYPRTRAKHGEWKCKKYPIRINRPAAR